MAYVGCGFVAQHIHLPNIAALAGARLVALAEKRPRLGRLVADNFAIPRLYGDHRALIDDPEVEAVGVSADYAIQGEIAADLLAAGKHVFMEKPMAISLAQADRVIAAARHGGARLMVGYMKRFDPANRLARAQIDAWQASGDMGRVMFARNHGFCGDWTAGIDRRAIIGTDEPLPPVSRDAMMPAWLPPENRNGYVAYIQQYTHNLNLLRFLLGGDHADRVAVRAVDLDADGMTGLVTLQIGGVRAVVESGRVAFHGWEEHTQVYFERGWVHAFSPLLFARPGQPRIEIYTGGDGPEYRYPVVQPITAWHYREEMVHFIDAVRSGAPFISDGEDTRLDVWLYEEIYRRHIGLA
jgi:predicted dehydrogenase